MVPALVNGDRRDPWPGPASVPGREGRPDGDAAANQSIRVIYVCRRHTSCRVRGRRRHSARPAELREQTGRLSLRLVPSTTIASIIDPACPARVAQHAELLVATAAWTLAAVAVAASPSRRVLQCCLLASSSAVFGEMKCGPSYSFTGRTTGTVVDSSLHAVTILLSYPLIDRNTVPTEFAPLTTLSLSTTGGLRLFVEKKRLLVGACMQSHRAV
jgi:hypothetical protein